MGDCNTHQRAPRARIRTAKPAGYRPLLSQWRAWFDGEGSGTPDPGTGTPPDKTGGDSKGNGDSQGERKFTQAELEHHSTERSKRAAESAVKKQREKLKLDELELSDEEAAEALANFKAKREADKSEAQKALDDKAKADAKAAQLEKEFADYKAAQLLKDRDSSIKDALRAAGVTDSEKAPNVQRVLVLLQAERKADVDALMGEDGTVDKAKLTKLVEFAKADYPDYFKAQRPVSGGSPSANNGRVAEPGRPAKERARTALRERVQKGW